MINCRAVVPAGSYRLEGQCLKPARPGGLCAHHKALLGRRGRILVQHKAGRQMVKEAVPA
jgi:hypothetical protein